MRSLTAYPVARCYDGILKNSRRRLPCGASVKQRRFTAPVSEIYLRDLVAFGTFQLYLARKRRCLVEDYALANLTFYSYPHFLFRTCFHMFAAPSLLPVKKVLVQQPQTFHPERKR